MSVLRSKDGTELIVNCSCGCDEAFRIKVNHERDDDMYFVLTYTNSNFYREQNSGMFCALGKKLKKIWRIIRNKDFCYSEICMTKQDVAEFKEYFCSLDEKNEQ